jgi:HK97 gp10 family phage protein
MAGSLAHVSGLYLDTSILDRMTAEAKPKAAKIVKKYGIKIAGDAAKAAPVASMASSGYVGGSLRNSILSESHMDGDMTFIVQDGVEYGIYNEYGTSRMAAQPFFVPAIEANRQKFLDAFAELFV